MTPAQVLAYSGFYKLKQCDEERAKTIKVN